MFQGTKGALSLTNFHLNFLLPTFIYAINLCINLLWAWRRKMLNRLLIQSLHWINNNARVLILEFGKFQSFLERGSNSTKIYFQHCLPILVFLFEQLAIVSHKAFSLFGFGLFSTLSCDRISGFRRERMNSRVECDRKKKFFGSVIFCLFLVCFEDSQEKLIK